MTASAKRVPKQDNVVKAPAFRVPASIEEAYELGWRWHLESFANLMSFGDTIEGVTRREGLAHFVGPHGSELVIPFVATYAFGEPRIPKRPYLGDSVYSVVDEEEPEWRKRLAQETEESNKCTQPAEPTPEEKEEERESLWKVEHVYKGEVIATFETRGTQQLAWETAADAFSDELEFRFSEIQPAAGPK